ncbi:hypothetical protein AALB39_05945 [Lachnospiraceae bacterium 54-53]
MPNQPVEITYVYEATGEGYRFTVNYLDNDALDHDLKNIVNPEIQQKTADTAVNAEYREFYGYTYESAAAVPAFGGSFDGVHDFTGTMPNDDLTVSYRYGRMPSKWFRITYQSGLNGSISHGSGVSPDVAEQSPGSGVYSASVLGNDGSEAGQTGSCTWGGIKEKRLVPMTQADPYYRFADWFTDRNGNGVLDEGEQLLAEDHRFTGDVTVTALFEEDPEKWIDIQFAAGEHGFLADGSITSLHIRYDSTWGDLAGWIPGYEPEINYLVDGWYDGDTEVESTDLLKNGHTYTIRFYPDPAVFGTDVDMMDYQLYRIFADPDEGSVQVEPVEMSEDPEETGGLFTFTARAGSRYVMVCSKAYRLYFLNRTVIPKYHYYFKVRKGEAPADGYYAFEYGQLEEPADLFVSEEGVEYNYGDWSYREDRLKAFDPDREISRKTYVYAYYEDNRKEVEDARKKLEDAIRAAIDKSDDYFLTIKETQKLKEAIEEALEVLDRISPKASLDELLEALEKLQQATEPLDEVLDERYDHYGKIQSSGSKGGSKGGGGSGNGIKASPYNPSQSRSYTVGTNGNWEQPEGSGNQWAFVLNGGTG